MENGQETDRKPTNGLGNTPRPNGITSLSDGRNVVFDDVDFSYDGKTNPSAASTCTRIKGQKVAFVESTGAGRQPSP